jgi:hypothetical protein
MSRKQLLAISVLGLAALAVSVPLSRMVRSGQRPSSVSSAVPVDKTSPLPASIYSAYGKLPLTFEENQGQTDARVKFLSRGSGYTVFLTEDETTTLLLNAPAKEAAGPPERALLAKGTSTPTGRRNAVVRLAPVGSNPHAEVEGLDLQTGRSNYFVGNDPARWRRNIPHYSRVGYRGIYPGVDLVYYGHQGQLESDYVVAAGADPSQIALRVEGTKNIKLNSQGDLELKTSVGLVTLLRPVAYQDVRGERQEISANYIQRGPNLIGIQVGSYDVEQPLIIDPVLAYSTYLGGTANQFLFQVAADSTGFAYVTGFTTSADFPTVTGSLNTTFPAGSHGMAFITKLKQDGSGLVYSTFLGGTAAISGNPSQAAHAIGVDSSGNAYVAGGTNTSDFPTVIPYQSINRGGGAFVSKLDPNGQNLLYSTYLTGTGSDSPNAIAVDASGNAYVAGTTTSKDFPNTPATAIQTTNKTTGAQIGTVFLTRINTLAPGGGMASLVYSTYLGGTVQESALGVAVDANANAYLTGFTSSPDFPGPSATGGKPNGFQSSLKDVNGAAFVARIDTGTPNALLYSTYLSGTANGFGNAGDSGSAIALGPTGDAYITGISYATDFPLVGAIDSSSNTPFAKVVIARIDTTKSGTASLIYSTYFGGTLNMVGGTGHGSDLGFGIKVDPTGNIYVAGTTNSIDFPVTAGAPQSKRVGIQNAFMSQLNPTGSAVLFSTYLGGSNEAAYSIALDGATPPNAFIAGVTFGNFPVTAGAFQTSDKVTGANNMDGFVAELSPGAVSGVFVTPPSLRFGNQVTKTKSSALTVALVNNTSAAITINAPGITILAGTNSSDFAIASNTCPAIGAQLAAVTSCTVGVTFTPSTTSSESATLSFADSDSTSPQQVLLTGTGTVAPPAVSVSPTSLNFGSQNFNTKSAAQTVTLTNSGTTAVTITGSGITIIGTNAADFAETNTCPAIGSTLAGGANCTISVTFAPTGTVAGSRTATLNIEDTDSSSPQQVTLTGNAATPGPADFTLALAPSSATVKAGSPANFTVTVMSFNGFNSAVSLSCSSLTPGAPPCTLSPTSVTPAANATATSSGSITTIAVILPLRVPRGPRPYPLIWLCVIVSLVLALLITRMTAHRTSRKLVWAFALLLFFVLAGCSGPKKGVQGTPKGTFTYTVKGTSGSLSHTTPFTLTVN